MELCAFCKKSRPVLRAEDLRNPYTECLNCGAIVDLPEYRYRVDWNTQSSTKDGRPWFQNFPTRQEALSHAKMYLKDDLDRAVMKDRWGIESPVVLVKNESLAKR